MPRQAVAKPRARSRLGVEVLADRMTPNIAPVIHDFAITSVGGGDYVLSGYVTDESPEGLYVCFEGPAGVQGLRAEVQSDGSYSLLVALSAEDAGIVTATTEDWFGLLSNTPAVWVSP